MSKILHLLIYIKLTTSCFQGNLFGAYFAFCAVVDGIQYKTGMGQNKKESKSNAAKLALDELLQLEEAKPKALEAPGKSFFRIMFWEERNIIFVNQSIKYCVV